MVEATRRCALFGSTVMPPNAFVYPAGVTFVQLPDAMLYFQIWPVSMGSGCDQCPMGPAPFAYVMYTLPSLARTARCGISELGAPLTAENELPPSLLR